MDRLAVDPHLTDPPLLRDNSSFKTYRTSRAEYPEIRVFFRQHAKASELYRSNGPLPLLVFIPGLGGSVAQFHPLLSSLVDVGPCLSMDWPGGGRSTFRPTSWDAYTQEALRELLEVMIEDHRDKDAGQTVILIGHSMGSALCATLANQKVPHKTSIADYVVGVVGICPLAEPMDEKMAARVRSLMWIPGWVLDLWRFWDGMGGPESPSVRRFVGQGADDELKLMQYRFNSQSRSGVFRRMLNGLALYRDGTPVGGFTGLDTWAGLQCPVYLIAGENDNITPAANAEKIAASMNPTPDGGAKGSQPASGSHNAQPGSQSGPAPPDTKDSKTPRSIDDIRDEHFQNDKRAARSGNEAGDDDAVDDLTTPNEMPADVPEQSRNPQKTVLTKIMPGATHTVLYAPRTARAVSGLIADFLSCHVTGRLSLAWQLQYLSREGKWDVKNLNKWRSVTPVSEPIGPSGKPIFRGMKTLREADDVHCPRVFVENWGPPQMLHVVDISKDQPVYDPRGLERAGIHYHKLPTVSKVPPPPEEVKAFIDLIDRLRSSLAGEVPGQNGDDAGSQGRPTGLIGVHCHYGFNRTGFLIVCYLVERCGFGVQQAIDAFATARPNGIKHSHFLDQLYVRYSIEAGR